MAKVYDSAAKRHKQSEVRHQANKAVKTSLRTSIRKLMESTDKKDAAVSGEAMKDLTSRLDSAARKGIIKKNAAARKKSRMQKRYNAKFGVPHAVGVESAKAE
jgi:small subunit ribosomal protein S20